MLSGWLIYTLVLNPRAGQSRRMGMFKKLSVEWENVHRVGTVCVGDKGPCSCLAIISGV